MKSRLFYIAHTIKNQFETFADALVHAWRVIKLQLALAAKAAVSFTYVKVSDGSIRKAVGTLVNVPETACVKKTNYGLMTYFDVEADAWRSCRIENLIF